MIIRRPQTPEESYMQRVLDDAPRIFGADFALVMEGDCDVGQLRIVQSYELTGNCEPDEKCALCEEGAEPCRTAFLRAVDTIDLMTADRVGLGGRNITRLQIVQFLHLAGLSPQTHTVGVLMAITFHLLDLYEQVRN